MCNLAAMPENILNYNSYVKHTKTLPSHSERATKYVTGLLEVIMPICKLKQVPEGIVLRSFVNDPYNGRHCSMNTHQWWWHILLRWSYFEFALTTKWWKLVHLMLLHDLLYFLDCHCKVTTRLLSKHPGAISLVLRDRMKYTSHFTNQQQFK
jgi:hypothetical protein